jgi:hypothetical protein
MSIASLVLVALMAFVLIVPFAMVAVLVLGVSRHVAAQPAAQPAPQPAAEPVVAEPVAQPAAA